MAYELAAAGAGISGSLIGGFIQKRENEKQRAHEDALNAQNMAAQREFAQMGIQWRANDARAAGLHPLAALGASGAQYTPSAVVGSADNSMSTMAADMGQNISRAIGAKMTAEERQLEALKIGGAQADLDGKLIDNQIRAQQLKALQAGPAAPSPSPGTSWSDQGDAKNLSKGVPLKRTNTDPGHPHREGAHVADIGWARTKTGIVPVPSTDVKERVEDQFIPETMWAIRNNIAPNFGGGSWPPESMLPKGADRWEWNYFKQEWQPSYPTYDKRDMEEARRRVEAPNSFYFK